ncbi:MAG: aminotransferase class III-fold pyridoxal phosphate-dependent enzyme [Thermomicrobiales bacterium]
MTTSSNRSYDASLALYDEALTLIPGGTQTTSKRAAAFAWGAYPIYLVSGQGSHVTDIDGNTYIDLVSGLGPVSLGYAHPAVDAAIREQLASGIISSLPSPLEVEVARLLVEAIPCAEQVRFFKGGGEATAAAARVARRFTGRSLILNCGYRGWPDVWTAASNDGGVPEAFAESIASLPFNDREAVEALIVAHPGEIAAIAIDVQATMPEPGYLAWLRDLAHEIGAVLIFDEIVTGFRLARGGAQEYFGVTPDLAVFAKGIANGMPLAAVAGRAEVMAAMTDATISITYGGEALSLAAAKAVLTVYRDEPVVETLHARGARLRAGLDAAAEAAGVPFATHGFDPMTAMRFDGLDTGTDYDAWTFLLQEMAERGVLLRRGGLNFVTYSHTETDVDAIVAAASEVFAALRPLLDAGTIRSRLRTRDIAATPAFRTFS